ncbi:MAG: hypothetical protein MJ228_03970 [Bacilli bacterium]|nr:hypothetical protein [Bacilli bacterium]
MKKNKAIIAALLPFMFSCTTGLEQYSPEQVLDSTNPESLAASEVSDVASESMKDWGFSGSAHDDASLTNGEDCGQVVIKTIIQGVFTNVEYDLPRILEVTVSYARLDEGEYRFVLLPGLSGETNAITICSDYFSEDDKNRCFGLNSGDIPSDYKTFKTAFDLGILKTIGTDCFRLAVCDERGFCGNQRFGYRIFFSGDEKIKLFDC